ncbi:MAG: RNB domain-containing ribonuclease, partial [Limnobacter sp.]|nr:RNB domain-containing ribonuclease [Limnobacter sp.]
GLHPAQHGHFGLAYPAYAHFTSPIRRYPDLMVHRAIKALLANKRYVPLPMDDREPGEFGSSTPDKHEELARWEQAGNWYSSTERRADEASRDVLSWLKCFFMKEKVGDTFPGHVSGVTSFGLFVTLDSLFVEGLVHVSELGSEYFQYNDAMHELRGERSGIRFRLTDPIQVQISRVDLDARRIEFRMVQGVKFDSLFKEPPPKMLKKHNARRKNHAQQAAEVQQAGGSVPVLPVPEPESRRGANKRRAAEESRAKIAAEKNARKKFSKPSRRHREAGRYRLKSGLFPEKLANEGIRQLP